MMEKRKNWITLHPDNLKVTLGHTRAQAGIAKIDKIRFFTSSAL